MYPFHKLCIYYVIRSVKRLNEILSMCVLLLMCSCSHNKMLTVTWEVFCVFRSVKSHNFHTLTALFTANQDKNKEKWTFGPDFLRKYFSKSGNVGFTLLNHSGDHICTYKKNHCLGRSFKIFNCERKKK